MKYFCLAILVVGSASCSDSTGPLAERIAVSPSIVILEQGDSVKLVATVLDASQRPISGVALTFFSEDTTVIGVSPQGMVRASGAPGATNVIVSGAGQSNTVPVTVIVVPGALVITPDSTSIDQLEATQLTAKVYDVAGDEIIGAVINFSSLNSFVASVSSTGLVTSVGPHGSATINARYGSLSRQVRVLVNQVPSFILAPGFVVLGAGDTTQLGAKVYDAIAIPMPGETINYVPTDPNIITVDPLGVITSVGPLGTTTLSATSGSLNTSVTVQVVPLIQPQAVQTVAGGPYGAAISPSGVIYVATVSGTLQRASLANFTFTTAVTALGNPRVVAFNATGDEAYVAGSPLAGVMFIDVASNTQTDNMGGLPGTPFDMAVASDGTIFLSTETFLYAIDPATHTVIRQVTTNSIGHLALHPSQPLIYFSAYQFGHTWEINTSTLNTVRDFNGGGQDITVSPDGTKLYLGGLTTFDLVTGSESYTPAGCDGQSLLLNHDGSQLYIGCPTQGRVNLFDLNSGTIVGTLRIPTPRHMAISSDGLSVVIPSQDGQVFLLQ